MRQKRDTVKKGTEQVEYKEQLATKIDEEGCPILTNRLHWC